MCLYLSLYVCTVAFVGDKFINVKVSKLSLLEAEASAGVASTCSKPSGQSTPKGSASQQYCTAYGSSNKQAIPPATLKAIRSKLY